jgi:DNA-binding transcriptional MerR regulator
MYYNKKKKELKLQRRFGMYSIGQFSKINRVTTKALRHYEKVGILLPEKVDEWTGYRYYSSKQLPRLSQIITLKQMGMSLTDIKEILTRPKALESFLKLQVETISQNIQAEQVKLSHVNSYLKRLKGEKMMAYHPVLKPLSECIVASMRFIAPSYDSYFEKIPKMGEEMKRLGAVCSEPAYCFNLYHDGEYKEKDIDVEVCEAVVDFCEDSETVKFKKIEGVKEALCVFHKGPYDLLPDAYNFALQWIEDKGYEIIDPPRESYIDGIWNKEDQADWLTELQIPVKKK